MQKTGDSINAENANWSFGGDVCDKFDEHVSKSVPLYKEGHELILKISDFFINDESICYELGCSTGKLTQALAKRNQNKKAKFIGIDIEKPMVNKAKERCKGLKSATLKASDILDVQFEKADLIIAYYTVQFIRPKNRQVIIDRIFKALNWGGAFLLFEKVRSPDARFQDMMTTIYTDYKIDKGYSSEEIVGKTRSLKGVLEPFSTQGNRDLLMRAGFVDIMTVMKYMCFEGFLAIK
ncbi:MAG: methyltransferase domain-containing protein [Candidatus Omnitrophica bacterium]|nr:methyltransferase domain-containing protein [Candidatus Omnitrophota bacterium]